MVCNKMYKRKMNNGENVMKNKAMINMLLLHYCNLSFVPSKKFEYARGMIKYNNSMCRPRWTLFHCF